MKKHYYPVIIQEEQNGYSATVPDIDGCFSEGDTIEELFDNVHSAIGLCLEDLKVYPTASRLEDINVSTPKQYIAIVEFDMLKYKKRIGNKSVKKTLTIPAWLNAEAEAQHINFSSVLQEALKEKLNLN